MTTTSRPTGDLSVSIIMPVLNEGRRAAATASHLLAAFPGCEVLVVDGGSTDDTLAGVRALQADRLRVLTAERGRARQLNAGAAAARGDVLWFVHADTHLDACALAQLRTSLADPHTVGGGLTLRFDRDSPALRYLAWTSNMRARRLHWIFGDQALFVRRSAFDATGRFPDLPIMEDLELSRRLAARGRLVLLPAASTASTRRFDQHGTVRMLLFMQWLKALYFAGVAPAALAARYARGPRLLPPTLQRRTHKPRPSAHESLEPDRARTA